MTELKKVPNPDKVRQTVERLRQSNRQLEEFTLALDEVIAVVETDLRRQRQEPTIRQSYSTLQAQEPAN